MFFTPQPLIKKDYALIEHCLSLKVYSFVFNDSDVETNSY